MSLANYADANLPTIVVLLRSLTMGYHHAHIAAQGESSYSDHLLLQRLYDGTGGGFDPVAEVDSVMERLKGLAPATLLDPARVAAGMQRVLESLSGIHYGSSLLERLLDIERQLAERLAVAIKAFEQERENGKDGVVNLLQGIADRHQTNQYLLQQRLKR